MEGESRPTVIYKSRRLMDRMTKHSRAMNSTGLGHPTFIQGGSVVY